MRVFDPRRDTIELYDSTMNAAGNAGGDGVQEFLRTFCNGARTLDRVVGDGIAFRYLGIDTVGGVACHTVEVDLPDEEDLSGMQDRWSVGVEDHLVRRRRDKLEWSGMTQWWELTVADLRTNVTIDRRFAEIEPGPRTVVHRRVPGDHKRLPVIAAGASAPAWTLSDSLGTPMSLRDAAGTVVVLDFWGSWCGPCIMALPSMQQLSDEYAERGVVVVGLSANEPPGARPTWLARSKGYTYPLLVGADSVARAYNVSSFPTTVIVGDDGTVIHVFEGYDPEAPHATERAALDAYLKERGR